MIYNILEIYELAGCWSMHVCLFDIVDVAVDVDAQCMLTCLRCDKIAAVLGPSSVAHFDVEWLNPVATDPNTDKTYLHQFMDVFESKMLQLIELGVAQQRSVTCDSHVVELLQHLTMCALRSQVCLCF